MMIRIGLLIVLLSCAPFVAAQPVTTVVTHGQSLGGEKGAWLQAMAEAIVDRAGAGAVFRYRADTGAWQQVSGVLDSSTPISLIFRWLADQDKAGVNDGFAAGAADALYAALRDPVFIDAQGNTLPAIDLVGEGRFVHFIGHSRGAIVNSECVRRCARAGVPVDHMTSLDPHPVNGTLDPPFDYDWGDPTPQKWSNTTFADNYWRADGGGFNSLDFDGIPLDNHFNLELNESALNCCAYTYAHSDVHLWYHGTIDLAQNPCDGEQCISNTARSQWWPPEYPWQTSAYYWSQVGTGVAERPTDGLQPGLPPGDVAVVYNGGFENLSLAGWLYHGGSIADDTFSDNGVTFLRLGAGYQNAAMHNRLYLPVNSGHLAMRLRIPSAEVGQVLRATLIARDGSVFDVGHVSLDQTSAWQDVQLPLTITAPRGETIHLQLAIEPPGPGSAVVEIDKVDIALATPATLDAYTLPYGSYESGGLDELVASDDTWLVVRSQFGFSVREANLLEVQVNATAAQPTPQWLNVTVESRMNNPGGSGTIRLFDHIDSRMVVVHTFATSFSDSSELLFNLDGSRYVRAADGRITCSVRHAVVATFSATGFLSHFDLIEAATH